MFAPLNGQGKTLLGDVPFGFKLFYFFFEAEFASLQFRDFDAIDERTAHFQFNLTMNGLMFFRKFLDMCKKAHFRRPPFCLTLYGTAILWQNDDLNKGKTRQPFQNPNTTAWVAGLPQRRANAQAEGQSAVMAAKAML